MLPTESMRRVLDAALANGGDLAEIYLENKESLSLTLDEGRLENATQGNDIGGGVRVFYGNNAAYAYTDDLTAGVADGGRRGGVGRGTERKQCAGVRRSDKA